MPSFSCIIWGATLTVYFEVQPWWVAALVSGYCNVGLNICIESEEAKLICASGHVCELQLILLQFARIKVRILLVGFIRSVSIPSFSFLYWFSFLYFRFILHLQSLEHLSHYGGITCLCFLQFMCLPVLNSKPKVDLLVFNSVDDRTSTSVDRHGASPTN